MKFIEYTIEMSPKMADLLDSLAKRSKCDRAEVIRRGVMMMNLAIEAREHGKFTGVTDKKENLTASRL
jgi:predicted transcriptional regulator